MILTMVGQFDHLLPTLRLICGVLGSESVAYLGYLCCRAEEWFARGWYSIKPRSYVDRFTVEILDFVVRELSGEDGYQYPE